MSENNVIELKMPETAQDMLTEVIRSGAKKLLAAAINAEVEEFLAIHQKLMEDGRHQYVRNGYLPERDIQTGIGEVRVNVPRIRDRSQINLESAART